MQNNFLTLFCFPSLYPRCFLSYLSVYLRIFEQMLNYSRHLEILQPLYAQLCLTLCDLPNCSPPGFSVHGIILARILEWVAISFSRGSSQSKDQPAYPAWPWLADSLPLNPLGNNIMNNYLEELKGFHYKWWLSYSLSVFFFILLLPKICLYKCSFGDI